MHIVSSYNHELANLTAIVGNLAGLAQQQLASALAAVAQPDPALSDSVRAGEDLLDRHTHAVQAECFRLLALRHPIATDLREVMAAIKIAGFLERIGDHAEGIARRSRSLRRGPLASVVDGLADLGRQVAAQLATVVDAYKQRDVEKAVQVWEQDQRIDERHTAIMQAVLQKLIEEPTLAETGVELMFIAKDLERIGDYATNIAESVHYVVTGRSLTPDRPKADAANFLLPPET